MKNTLLLLIFTLSIITTLIGQENRSAPSLKKNEIYTVVEEMPRFPGCEDETDKKARMKCTTTEQIRFIYGNLKYPKRAKKNKVAGRVVVKCYVDVDGSLKDIKIIKSLDDDCDQAALDVVHKMNEMEEKWTPGKQRGKAVKVYYNIVVQFKL